MQGSDNPEARPAQEEIPYLEYLIETRRILTAWRVDLLARIERARLCTELIGLSRGRLEELKNEGDAWIRCSRAFIDSVRRWHE